MLTGTRCIVSNCTEDAVHKSVAYGLTLACCRRHRVAVAKIMDDFYLGLLKAEISLRQKALKDAENLKF